MSPDADPADDRLLAVLDTVIPPADDMPGAGLERVAVQLLADAADGRLATGLSTVLALLPADFVAAGGAAREKALRNVADTDPGAVASVVNLVYTAYYSDPDVLRSLERVTGYHAEPPQPRGYTLEPFDRQLLATARARGVSWRPTS